MIRLSKHLATDHADKLILQDVRTDSSATRLQYSRITYQFSDCQVRYMAVGSQD